MRTRLYAAGLFLLVLAIGAFAPLPAHAQDATLTYTPPTTYVDGRPLPTTEIAGYDARCSSFTPTGGTSGTCPIASGSVTGNVLTIKLSGTLPVSGGNACFQVRARSTKVADPSDWTSAVCKAFPGVPPGTPNNVTIAVVIGVDHSPVYRINADGTRGSAVLGFIEPNKPALAPVVFRYRSRDWCRVKPEDVKWWATAPTVNVAAACTRT